jgi:hypothetical protein
MEFRSKSCKTRTNSTSKTSLRFWLQECQCEFDLSVVDRINAVLNSTLHFYTDAKLDPLKSQVSVVAGFLFAPVR